MKSKVLLALLLISVAFNAAFISRVFHFRRIRSNIEEKYRNRKNDKFPELHDFREFHRPFKEAVHLHRDNFMRELSAPEIDEKKLVSYRDSMLSAINKSEFYLADHLIEVRKKMTPEEAKRFCNKFDHLHNRMHRKMFRNERRRKQ